MLCTKGETETDRTTDTKLGTVNSQKDLGVIMAKSLSRSDNNTQRVSKSWRAFFNLKRSISSHANLETKLNVYIGYVVPFTSYASQVWYPSKFEMKKKIGTTKSKIMDTK